MGMYSRLFLPIFVIIAMVVGVRYHLLLDSETSYAQARYLKDAGELAAHLRKTLEPALATPDRGRIDTALSSALLPTASRGQRSRASNSSRRSAKAISRRWYASPPASRR